MKKMRNYFSALAICVAFVTVTAAQDAILITNPKSEMMLKDLNTRNPNTVNQKVDWVSNEYGNSGMYTVNNVNYMTRYDGDGNYIETYKKRDWNDAELPASLKSAFNSSNYKDSNVTSFWESSDYTNKGYYMELTDRSGQASKVWVDDKGKFNTTPGRTTGSKNRE
ncbi:hypothetical protein BH09BAC3_BH09BAC3_19650 [soil metagenome]